MKKLTDLTIIEFNELKDSGMLWEFYPNAPEFYDEIKQSALDKPQSDVL